MKNLIYLTTILSLTALSFKTDVKTDLKHVSKESKNLNINAFNRFLFTNTVSGTYGAGATVATSTNGQFHLVYQTDGNLVLYTSSNAALWASGPQVSNPGYVDFNSSGDIRAYTTSGSQYWRAGLQFCDAFPTHTWVLQDDGNFVIYYYNDSCKGTGAVSTGTQGGGVSHHFGIID